MLIFRTIKSLLNLYLLRKNVPIFVNLSVTDRCNFRCSHCKIPERNNKELSKKEIFNIVDDLDRLGTWKIGICGGEPLMREDIGDIIDYVKSKNIFITAVSNGTLLREKIEKIKNLDLIMISFDGPPQAQENVRGKQAYEIAIDAIKFALENKLKVMAWTVLTKDNIKELDSILETAESMGFACAFNPVYQYSMSGNSVKNLFPDKEEFRATIEKIEKIKKGKKGHLVANSQTSLRYMKAWPQFLNVPCWAGKSYIYIDTDGRVYPCNQMIMKTAGVSLSELRIEEAIKKTERLDCPGCWCMSSVEHNYFFSFNLGIWLHYLLLATKVKKTRS